MDYFFEVLTPLGFNVKVTHQYWNLIATVKHPMMNDHEYLVQDALERPDQVRQSQSDPDVYLFYKSKSPDRWICAVAKDLNGDGFLITAYLTEAIKEGEIIWPR